MRFCPIAASTLLFLALLLVSSCTGSGSDLGPSAPGRASRFLRGQVEDCGGRPIVSARFRALGPAQEAVTTSTGRFLLPNPMPGTWLCEVDGRFGSSGAGSRFGRIRLALPISAGPADLPGSLVLPDLAQGALLEVEPGPQAEPVVLETAQGRLVIPSGSDLALQEAGAGLLGLGELGVADLPLALEIGSGVALATLALVIDPPGARFEPGGALRIANALGLPPTQAARFYRLHPQTGQWEEVAQGEVSGDGLWIQAPAGSVAGGGVYLFAVTRPLASASQVSGLVKSPLGWPVQGALVRSVEGLSSVTGPDGSFTLDSLAGSLASDVPRQVPLVIRAGGGWAPGRLLTTLELEPGAMVSLGEIELDTRPTGTSQVVGALMGEGLAWRTIRGGAGDMVFKGRLDGQGLLEWEDVPLGRIMARTGWLAGKHWYSGIAQRLHVDQDRVGSLLLVTAEGNPRTRRVARGITLRLVAAGGGGPLFGAEILVGRPPDIRRAFSDEHGLAWLSGLRGPQIVTATRLSRLGGRTLRAAVTLDGVDNHSFELALPILTRSSGSEFVPFGEVEGRLSGGRGGTLAVTGRSYLDPWEVEAALLQGVDRDGQAPLRCGPPNFCVGVPAGRGTLVATELESGALVRMGLKTQLQLVSATRTPLDLDLDLPATGTVRLMGVLAGLDGRIDPGSVTGGLGFRLASGEGVLVARGLSLLASGQDLLLQTPALVGPLAAARRIIALRGAAESGGVGVIQRCLAKGGEEHVPVHFLPAPALVRPQPSSLVDPSELVVEWGEVPVGTSVLRLELRWTEGLEEGIWDVWVRPDRGSFAFLPFPEGGFSFWPSPGTELRFTLTAFRLEGSFLALDHSFDRFLGALTFAEPEELGVTALSSIHFATQVR